MRVENKNLVEQITKLILDAILNGDLKPGDKIPTEAEFAQMLGVGRNSFREAIKILEAKGVVTIRRSDGTYINDHFTGQMLEPMLYGLILQNKNWQDFIDLRSVVDIGTMHLVIRRMNSETEVALRRRLADLKEVIRQTPVSIERIIEVDHAFHLAMSEITGNELLITVNDYILRMTTAARMKTVEKIVEHGELEKLSLLHEQWIKVLVSRDSSMVEKVVLDHYQFWKEGDRSN